MLSSKDINFVGYTYKNFEIVNDYQVPGIGIFIFLHFKRLKKFDIRTKTLMFRFTFSSRIEEERDKTKETIG